MIYFGMKTFNIIKCMMTTASLFLKTTHNTRHILVIIATSRLKWKYPEFKASVGYLGRPLSSKQNKLGMFIALRRQRHRDM